jgi:hypothetical protein
MPLIPQRIRQFFHRKPNQPENARQQSWENLEKIRNKILARWEKDFRRGAASGASELHHSFHSYIEAETERLTTGIFADNPNTMALCESQIYGWAAHFMPIAEYEEFYVATIYMSRSYSPAAARHAWRAVDHLRSFPRLIAAQTRCLSKTLLGEEESEPVREARLQKTRNEILAQWKEDFERGALPNTNLWQRSFHAYLQSENAAPTRERPSVAQDESRLNEARIHGWAAHFMKFGEYKKFYTRTIIANRHEEIAAARQAIHTDNVLSKFSPLRDSLDHCASPRKLELSQEDLLKEAWCESEPLVSSASSPDEIDAFFANLTADDLHEIAHGEDLLDAPLIEAVARHPLCDWGSAFEILHSFSAASYQSRRKEGKQESDFDELDQSLFRIFDTIATRATGKGFKSHRFRHNADWGEQLDRKGEVNPYHPANWVKWRLPNDVLKPTKGEKNRPSIVFTGGEIRPTFEVWKQQR